MKKILLFTSILFLTITSSLFAQHPTALVASNITSTSVDLSWDASICGGSVNLRYRIVGGVWNPNITGVTSPHLLSGLLANTDYEWTVKCVGTNGWSSGELFTTAVVGPTISNAVISQPILCNGAGATSVSAGMQINIVQTSPPTTYSAVIGYYVGATFFVSYLSTNQTTTTTLNLTGFNPNVDYCIRIVDSVAYYTANGGSASGTGTVGIYDEWCAINFSEPAQLVASTSVVASNLCVGDCIAAEDLLISGGTEPYSFTINGGASQNLAAGDSTYSFIALCAGNYDIVVTDANGCSTSPSTTTFIIAPIAPIVPAGTMSLFNLNGYHVSCNGASDGIITAAANGGTGVFTYSIDGINFQSSAIFSGLSAGPYTITYKDANDCIATESFVLNEPPALSGTASVTQDVDCYNANTGEITFTVDPTQPGIPIYQYSDDNGSSYQSSAIFPNLLGNINYDIIVMDNNACQFTSTVYLAEPTQIIYSTTLSDYNSYEVSCDGDSDGSIEFTSIVGGLSPYEFSTDAGANFDPAIIYTNLSSGTYNIEVKDASGCIETSVITLNDPGLFSVPFVISNAIDCPGDCNGAISINPSNGVGTISYDLDGGSPQATPYFSGICGDITNGSYTLDAIDDNGCTASEIVSLAEPTDFVYTTSSNLEYCDQSNGQASITVTSGGTGGLSYLWNNNPLQNSAVANNLVAGTYTVVVTDGNFCQFSETVIVSADIGFTVSFTTVSPCLGDSSGGATVSATGIPTFSYQWSDVNGIIIGETSATISGMPIGSYSVDVLDATSCVITGNVDIIPPVDPIVIDSVVVTNSSCFGIDDAQIEIFASGGQQSYSYSNTNGLNTQPNPVFGMLNPDTYGIQAIDANGCFDDTSITLSYPGLLAIDSTVFTHISCFGLNDGAVQDIQFVGGTAPFEFSIDGGQLQSYPLFTGIEPGTHTIEIEDANNCDNSDIIIVNEPTLFEVETTVSDWNNYQIRCNGDNSGYVDIQAWGGTAPYVTDSTSFWNSINIDSISAGIDTFIVQDANGCEYQEIIVFNEPSPIQHNFIATHVSCVAWNNGAVTDSVYGGVGSSTTYSYLWDSGETTYSLANLSAGTYTITVTDENGCEDTESVVINASNAFNVNQGTTIDVGCFDDCDGELSVTTSGGVPFSGLTSYTYLWNDYLGQNTDTAVGLCVDSISLSTAYSCIVSDAVGCTDTIYFTLIQPAELQVDVSITSPISCNGLSDGKLKANVTGGTPTYTYSWSNGTATPIISGLSLGVYKVTIEDANTCRDTFEIYLGEPTLVGISIDHYDISCFGDSDGKIEVLGTGGTSFESTYSYTLYSGTTIISSVIDYESGSISQTPFVFSNLGPGNYYVIVEDYHGCSATSLSVEITEPFEPLTLLVDTVDETCLLNDGIIRMFPEGGSQSFNYFINGTPTLNNSNIIGGNAPGWYAITVIDTRGCEINDVTFIKDYRKIFLPDTLSNIDTTICLGQSIIIDVDENSELSYSWNDGVETGDRIIMPEVILAQGENATVYYTLTITDVNDCEQENIVVVHFTSIDPMLESDPEFYINQEKERKETVVLSGQDLEVSSNNFYGIEYTWRWSNDTIITTNSSITIQELSETDLYYLKVKDANGCLGYDSIYVVVGVKPYEAFTPNGDNINDTWTPLDIRSYENSSVQVFNRWGGLVFESSGSNYPVNGWDGTNEGDELPVGTYYYIIDLNTGDEPQTGPITIIR
jgi:gliding motility-associated-like protein